MNESEGSSILADIQALEKALVLDIKVEQTQQEQDDCDNHLSFSADASPCEVDDEHNYLDANRDIDADQDSLNAYKINERLIVGLTITKEKLTVLLQKCDEKIKQLDAKMKVHTNGSSSRRCPISSIGIPYFKDKNNFSAPMNYDTKLKESRGELFLLSLKSPGRWSEKDRDILLGALHNQAIESVLLTSYSVDDNEEGSGGEEPSEANGKPNKTKLNSQQTKSKFALPKSLGELVGALGEREFDWCKISVTDFDGKHSPEECRAMWNVYLHPQIRKSNWTDVEDKRLVRYAKHHRFQDWDTIALRLQTNRSAYQCFIRYNTIKGVPSAGRAWSKTEDKHLVKLVNTLKIGDYIPWSQVASYLCHRTKQQIYTRWTYRKAPHLRKGRFTQVETDTLVEAVSKYGKDFSKISNAIMQNRTAVQLSEHYYTLTRKKIHGANVWTIDDDMKLIKLHKKYDNNWSRIQSAYFVHKTRTQVRHRFNALVRYIKKGISIECIPRHPSSHKNTPINNKKLPLKSHDKDTPRTLEELPTHTIITTAEIQLRLYETLSFPLSTKITDSRDEVYNLGQLACQTKKLYNVLKLLDFNLDVPYDVLKYLCVSRKYKQLLLSLKEYITKRTNGMQNGEIENLRLQMFGNGQSVGKNSRFIPPIPFCGYTGKTRKVNNKMRQSIDCVINLNQTCIIDALTEFPKTPAIEPFISIEERDQFDKFSRLLTNNRYDYERKIRNLDELEYTSFFNERDIKYYTRIEQSSNLQEATQHVKEDKGKHTCSTHTPNDAILPNRATLLGFKNLLLWKLLHEYQIKSGESSSFMKASQKSEETVKIDPEQSDEYKRAYKLLRTRLYQLFKFPIGLSSTIFEMCDQDTIFLETAEQTTKNVSNKRKYEDANPVLPLQSNETAKVNILADSNCQQNTNIKTVDLPLVRSSKIISKRYKIIAK